MHLLKGSLGVKVSHIISSSDEIMQISSIAFIVLYLRFGRNISLTLQCYHQPSLYHLCWYSHFLATASTLTYPDECYIFLPSFFWWILWLWDLPSKLCIRRNHSDSFCRVRTHEGWQMHWAGHRQLGLQNRCVKYTKAKMWREDELWYFGEWWSFEEYQAMFRIYGVSGCKLCLHKMWVAGTSFIIITFSKNFLQILLFTVD